MNHIYKVVWSKVKNCYVVVSEIARNGGKEHSRHAKKMPGGVYILPLALALNFGLPSSSQSAEAADLGNGAAATYDTNGNLVIGNKNTVAEGTKQQGKNNTTIGTDSDTLRNVTDGDTTTKGQPMDAEDHKKLVDGEGQAHDLDEYKSTEAGGSTAVGYNNHNEGDRSTAIGNTAKITNKPVVYYVDKDGNKTASAEDAVWYKDANGNPTKVPQVFRDADGNMTKTAQYVHTYTEKDPTTGKDVTKTEITSDANKADQKDGQPVYNYDPSDNTAYLYTVTLYQSASNSIAAGTDVTANGSNAVAVGYNSTADNSAVAIGDTAKAAENAVAIGKETKAAKDAAAIGNNTKANVEGSIALGKGSQADRSGGITGWDPKTGTTSTKSGTAWVSGAGALSIGNGGTSRQITNVAAGSEDSDAVNLAQLKEAMTHYYSVKTTAETDAAGNNNYLNDGATGDNALAAGVGAKASGNNATAVGYNTTAPYERATAMGAFANATSSQATAIGSSASATSSQSTAIGYNAGAHGDYATALGSSASATNTYAIAIGASANASYENSTAVGASAKATDNQATAIGSSAGATATYATALGNSASATSYEATAIGSGAGAHGSYAIAMGNGASATNTYAVAIGAGANAPSYQATALGNGASATSYEATAIGSGAYANSSYGIAIGNGASAQYGDYNIAIGNGTSAQNSSYNIAIGKGASAQNGNGTALGYNAKTTAPNGTALGSGASAYYHALALGNDATASSSYALAAGDGAQANVNDGIALGSHATVYRKSGQEGLDTVTGALSSSTDPAWKSTYGALSIGNISSDGTVNGTRQITGVAAGSQDTDAVNVAQLKAALRQTGTDTIHDYSVNSANTTTDTNYNYDADTGSNALAAGVSAKATGMRSVAVGNGAKAQGADSIAIGTNAVATGQGAMVIGQYNTAEGQNSLAFGGGYNDPNKGNKASSTAAVAFGEGSWAVSEGSVAFGYGTQAGNTIKDSKGNYTGQNAVAFGNGTKALGGRSLAFGENTTANYNDSVAFGNGATAYSTGTVAFGNRSRALSQYATSFGDNSVAAGSMSFAFGTDNIAGAALDDNGALELTDGSRMDSYGNKAYTTTDAAGKTTTYSIKGMGIPSGGDIHDYVVVTGTKADGTPGTYVEDYQGGIAEVKVNDDGTVTKVKDLYSGKYGGWYQYDEQGNIIQTGTGKNKKPAVVSSDTLKAQKKPIPVTLDKATPGSNGYTLNGFKNATAFGYSTEASGDNATAFGNDTKAKAAAATAFGTTTTASGVNATAFGLSTTASGDNATAFGEGSTASGEAATAFGISSNASGKNSLAALGGTASAENAAAIGSGAQATLSDSVALGSNSKTTRAKYSALTDAKEKAAYAKGSTSTGSAWEATDNAIAVGNDSTTTRQITGVAAGSLDTDAVNVAQLKAVDAKHTIVTVGGNSVTADNTPVNGGNLDLKRTTATNGQETYDLSLDKNVTLGEQVENNGGKLTVNNVDKFKNYDKDGKPLPDTTVKEAVKIDGKTVSVVKHDGSAADNDQRQVVLGVDQDAGGYVTLYDNTGRKPTYIYNAISGGITYLKDKDSYLTPDLTNPNDERASNEFNRLEYGDYHTGTTQFIATLDDGQKYAGDNYEAAKTETKTVDGKTTTTVTKEEQNVLLKKLNERLDIKGGATGALTDNNIGVNVKDGVMNVQLAQNIDLGDKGSVTMGNTTINNGGVTITTKDGNKTNTISLTENGLNNGGKTITNVGNGTNDSDAVNVSQLNAAKTTVKSSDNSISVTENPNGTPNHAYDIKVATATLSNGADGKVSVTNPNNNANSYATGNSVADAINKAGFTLTTSNSGGGSVDGATNTLIHPGDTVTIDAGKNISLKQENGKISIATKDNLNLGSADSKDDKQQDVPGTDGSITVNGKNGSAVAINGKDGSIGLTGPKGTDGKSTSIQISTIMSTSTLDDGKNIKTTTGEGEQQKTTTQAPRIQYKNGDTTYEVATMDDGQKYGGDNYVAATDKAAEQNVITKKLNERLDIKGGAAKDKLTEKNIGVNVENGVMKVQLAQNLDLDDKGSVKMGNTTINNGGVTITTKNGDNTNIVSLTENGLNNGGKTITNVGNGTKDSDAVNVSQLNAAKTTLKSSDNSISVTENPNGTPNHAYDIKVATATLSNETDGKVSVTNPDNNANSYATGNSVANAINNSGFKLIASASEGTVTGNKETLIHPGDTVTIDAGKNISLTQTDSKISIATKDKLVLGKDTSDGKDGQEGTIGLTGKDGLPGADGKQGYSTTIIKTEKGQAGKDGKTGKENLGGTDITRIVYTDKDGSNPQTVATLSDGLKFAGDDMSKTVDKKLNETLQIRGDGTYDKEKNTVADDGNIKTSVDNGAVKVSLSDKINLHQDGYLTVGGSKNGNAADGNDPIVIKHFDDKTLDVITGVDKEGKPIIAKVNKAGDYVTGLDNKDWNVDKPEYVSGRAATEDQLKTISDTIKSNAETAAGQHTAVTVNDKDNETTAPVGTDGKYSSNYGSYSDSSKGNLLIAAKTKDGQTTYNIKLNDQLAIGQKGEQGVAGKDGQDGKVTVETSKGTTVVIGHDGEPGKDGKDGISVKGQDGKDGVTISVTNGKDGKDGSEGHIGLTGPKGADGKDGQNASADIHVKNGQVGVDGTDGNKGTNGMDRVVYEDHNHVTHEVATMDDGLKIGANAASKEKAANPVSNKLNSTINIMGSAAKTGHTYTDDNLTTTVEQDKDGNTTVKVLMDKDITGNSVTVGEKGESGTPGKDGVDGTIGVNGKDGSSVVIKGTDGISINGKDGQNGVTIKGVDGKAGTEGHIGLTGPKGPKGADGKDGQNASADIHVVNGHVGVDGTDGNKGTNGMDRVVYEDHNHVTHEVATMDDGLKFAGDDVNTTVAKKLNSTLQIRGDGTYDKEKNTVADDGNIKTSVDNGAVKVSLSDKINLHQDGYLTVGGSKNGNAADGNDPIVIKHFDDKTLDVITGVDKEGKPIIAKEGKAGDYVTGLDNKNWNVDKPEYVSGRAATEDQLKTISDAVKEAATTAGKHTVITVENGKAAGTTDYNGENLKLKVTEKDGQKTYDLKLNDKVTLGKDGVDGSIGLKGADGKSSIGLNGKDGISVIGKDGQNGVSITGSNGLNGENGIDGKIAIGTPGKDGQPGKDAVSISGQKGEGHIGLTGPAGKDGKDASADIHVKNGQVG
ncbi:ESPR-type extended signal peptide-containing protein, partial [Mitsuokella multacida]|uniref:ESPR-type extended signal peptide-containing protein n=1 Tax=Mitsuokella multacida TaxID=52226 RepID=UPI00265FC72A